MNKIYLFINFVAILFVIGCNDVEEKSMQHRIANGGIHYGGVFHINEVENFTNLFPHLVGEVSSYNIGSQIYEGLVRLDPKTLEVIPGIAKSWDISEDGLEYTFHLREGVYFHDNPCFDEGKGRELMVDDCVYSLTNLCTPSPMNKLFYLVRNMGDHLDSRPEVIAAPLFFDYPRIDLPCRDIVAFRGGNARKPLIVSEVKIGLGAVISDEHLTVLIRRHGARIDI